MVRCFVALGGNLGTVEKTFQAACEQLAATSQIELGAVSNTFRTPTVGNQAGDDFVNGAIELFTDLNPLALLDELQQIENRLGRTRERQWGPRTLDLDLLLYDNQIIDVARLCVPHPALWYRRFVLDPLSEIAADVVHPEKLITIDQLRSRIRNRPLRVCLAGGDSAIQTRLIDALANQFSNLIIENWESYDRSHGNEPHFLFWLGTGRSDETAPPSQFESLPRVPRLDATAAGIDSETFLSEVLQSALGE